MGRKRAWQATARLLVGAVAGLQLTAAGAGAQEPSLAAVRPGEVSTVIPQLVLGTRSPSRYTIEPAPGFRMLGPIHGVLPAGESGAPRLPITFVTPADAVAGPAVAGSVLVEWPGGGPYEIDIRIHVETVRALQLELSAAAQTLEPDAMKEVSYRLTNQGNAVDTVRLAILVGGDWTVTDAPAHILAPNETVTGSFAIRAPATAPVGEQRLVRVRTGSDKGDANRSIVITVVEQAERPLGLAGIPASLFLGGVGGEGEFRGALTGSGSIGPETEVGIALRHAGSRVAQAYGHTELWGPRALLTIRHEDLSAAVGEMGFAMDGLARGMSTSGLGLQVREGGAGWSGGAMVGRPRSWYGNVGNGHLVQAELGRQLGPGALSARVTELGRGAAAPSRTLTEQVLGLRYAIGGHTAHRMSLEGGIIRLASGGGDPAAGAAVDASYRYTGSKRSLAGSFRHVPRQLTSTSLAGSEAALNGTLEILPRMRASASAFQSTRGAGLSGIARESRGGSAGLHVRGLGSSLGLVARVRDSRGGDGDTQFQRRASASASLSTGVGPLSLATTFEAGRVDLAAAEGGRFHLWRGQVRWDRRAGSVWINANLRNEPLFRSPLQVEAGTRLQVGPVSLDAVAGANAARPGLAHAYAKGSAEVAVTRSVSLVAGVEHRTSLLTASPPTLSFGIRKALRLPLPVRERPAIEGVVFEDRNGNGRRDPGEPGVAGVEISAGSVRMTTDRRGSFSSRRRVAPGSPVRLHLGERSGEYLALSIETLLPESGRVEMSVVRPGSVELSMFEDADSDGSFGPGEDARGGVVVVLRGPQGRSYSRTADSAGRVRFASVVPGEYRVLVQANAQQLAESSFAVRPGADAKHQVALRAQVREIRMWGVNP